ncbi:MAG: hypothetical protein RLZZ628_1689, partial [Bacteroidota bacterium]
MNLRGFVVNICQMLLTKPLKVINICQMLTILLSLKKNNMIRGKKIGEELAMGWVRNKSIYLKLRRDKGIL